MIQQAFAVERIDFLEHFFARGDAAEMKPIDGNLMTASRRTLCSITSALLKRTFSLASSSSVTPSPND